jgi:hypothetical protein
MPRIFLTIKVIIMGMMILLPTTGFAVDSSTRTLLQFLETEPTPRFPLLPPSLSITDSFKPSATSYAGTIVQLKGTAYIYHKEGTSAYKVRKDLPVFNGDTLVTAQNSRVTLQMSDDTTLVLTAQTKLLIEKSLPRMKARDTVLQLFFGRIRALVKKLSGEYTIKTTNSSVGVRGTDFAVAVAPTSKNRPLDGGKKVTTGFLTAVLTGGHQSTVELNGLFGPSVTVKPFSVARVPSENRAEQAVYIGPSAVALLEQIAPQQHEVLPTVSVASCWMVSVKILGTEKKKYFKVCKPGQKPVEK